MSRVAALLVSLLVLVSCSPLPDTEELRRELRQADYRTTDVDHSTTDGFDVLTIQVRSPDGVPTDDEATEVAEIVLTTYQPSVDQLVITIDDRRLMDATAGELTERFGEHPTRSMRLKGSGIRIIVGTLAVAMLVAALVMLTWWRGRRPQAPIAPPYPPM